MIEISSYDKASVGAIIGGQGDWWGAQLLRLLHKSDLEHFAALAEQFPSYARAYQEWAETDPDYNAVTLELLVRVKINPLAHNDELDLPAIPALVTAITAQVEDGAGVLAFEIKEGIG